MPHERYRNLNHKRRNVLTVTANPKPPRPHILVTLAVFKYLFPMRTLLLTLTLFFGVSLSSSAQAWLNLMNLPQFERAVRIIKYYEQWHTRKHYPYIGYGQRIQPGENLTYPITPEKADAILHSDLRKHCAMFRSYERDSLLLACLSYNCGPAVLLGNSKKPKSDLLKKLEAGRRDILPEFLGFCHFNGKRSAYIEHRRWMECQLLFR